MKTERETANFKMLIGRTLTRIEREGDKILRFVCDNGDEFEMYHYQDCCEIVELNDVCGNLDNLIGTPIVMAEEVNNINIWTPEYADSYTWTFYKLATIKGYVTLSWLGESNGYYSQSVDFDLITSQQPTMTNKEVL